MVIIHVGDNGVWFFSTSHMQDTPEEYVPITFYQDTRETVITWYGEDKRIPNPNPEFEPKEGN